MSEKSSRGHLGVVDHIFVFVHVILPVDAVGTASLIRGHTDPMGVCLMSTEPPQFDISFVNLPVLFSSIDWRRSNRGGRCGG